MGLSVESWAVFSSIRPACFPPEDETIQMTDSGFPRLGNSRGDLAARAIALLVVLCNAAIYGRWLSFLVTYWETLITLGLLASLILSNGNSAAHGLVLRPRQGWRHWFRFALAAAGVIFLIGFACAGVWWTLGWPLPLPRKEPAQWQQWLYWMCLSAPLNEEIVYRMLLTIALLPLLGERWTIVVSGLLFGMIHIFGGNPGPDNLLAGFFLQWAYLRSGTLLVPLAMHSAGNAIALTSHVLNSHFALVGI